MAIVAARYPGTYEGGRWWAVAQRFDDPELGDVSGSELECFEWFGRYDEVVGRGDNPTDAFDDLRRRLRTSAIPGGDSIEPPAFS